MMTAGSRGGTDPLADDVSNAIGGPPGAHARPARQATALVVCLAVATLAMTIGALTRTECASGAWWQEQRQFANLCYSDLPHEYVRVGLAEQVGPLDDGDGRWAQPGLSTMTAATAYVVARVSHAVFGVVDPVDRNDAPTTQVAADPQVRDEAVRHTAVAAVLLALAALAATGLLAGAHPGRPWDALGFAAAPVLVLSGLIGWDLLAVVCACGALWAWSRNRPVVTGMLIGLGAGFALWPLALLVAIVALAVRAGRSGASLSVVTASLLTWVGISLPAYLWRPDGWLSYWERHLDADAGLGSLWQVSAALGLDADATLANQAQLLGWLLVLAFVVWVAASPRRPRVPQLALLALVAAVLVSKSVPVQASLWVLAFAVLARPRWRDLLVWQACEAFYFCATWWHLGAYTDAGGNGEDAIYPIAVLVRTAGLLWLAAVVLRDVRQPWYDPVRADGTADDPAGGVLDEEREAVS